jgi:hypothetical protein
MVTSLQCQAIPIQCLKSWVLLGQQKSTYIQANLTTITPTPALHPYELEHSIWLLVSYTMLTLTQPRGGWATRLFLLPAPASRRC